MIGLRFFVLAISLIIALSLVVCGIILWYFIPVEGYVGLKVGITIFSNLLALLMIPTIIGSFFTNPPTQRKKFRVMKKSRNVSVCPSPRELRLQVPRRFSERREQIEIQDSVKIEISSEMQSEFPFFTILYVAYLPNEKDIILDIMKHALTNIDYPIARYNVLLAYNTPHDIDEVERHLYLLEQCFSNFKCVRVPNSKSKSANINYALDNFIDEKKTEFVGIYDTDHIPDVDVLRQVAVDTMKFDVIQGRGVIRNNNESIVTRVQSIEHDLLFGVIHPGRYRFFKFALFAGSNGYWRTSLIKKVKFDDTVLGEDIDASFNAILYEKAKFTYNPNVVSRELAPSSLSTYFNQRVRWSQAWLQILIRYLFCWDLWKMRPRLHLIPSIELIVIPFISQYIFATFGNSWIIDIYNLVNRKHIAEQHEVAMEPYFALTTVINYTITVVLALSLLIAIGRSSIAMKNGRNMIVFVVLLPFYLLFHGCVNFVSHVRELLGVQTWLVTKRN